MFSRLKDYLHSLASGVNAPQFAPDDYRLAAAALLVHAMHVDGKVPPTEIASLRSALSRRFALDPATTDQLITKASERQREMSDLEEFTQVINRALDVHERRKVLAMLTLVMNADGSFNEFEASLIERVASLLEIHDLPPGGGALPQAHS